MPAYVYVVLLIGWLAWVSAFIGRKRATGARTIDKHARWGMVLQGVGFALVWQARFWEHAPGWKLFPAIAFMLAAALLSWTGVSALGPQWRLDAGLNADHRLVRSGPYALIRHPIYASMLCMLLGTGLILSPWWLFLSAVAVFLIGTEIRVRTEDALLGSQFGSEFTAFQRKTPAYIPWVR